MRLLQFACVKTLRSCWYVTGVYTVNAHGGASAVRNTLYWHLVLSSVNPNLDLKPNCVNNPLNVRSCVVMAS